MVEQSKPRSTRKNNIPTRYYTFEQVKDILKKSSDSSGIKIVKC